MITKRQAITVWNEWAKYQVTRPLLGFIGLYPHGITDDETYEHIPGVKVQDAQAKRAAEFLRLIADALEQDDLPTQTKETP